MAIPNAGRTIADVRDEAHHRQILERGWETGGFYFVFNTFDDLLTNPESNEKAAEFVRNKIRAVVEDEETAEMLCPKHPILAKRPPLGHFYYEAYNRPNVKLVDISKNPIKEMTPQGLRTETEDYEFDIIIFAIGFDAATGALAAVDIEGENGVNLNEKWSQSLESYLGIMVEGFPNMFMISGPQSPFANIPIVIDGAATWIGKAIEYMRHTGKSKIAATKASSQKWAAHVNEVFQMTLLASAASQVRSWYVGTNVPGKPENVLFYFGGVGTYFGTIEKEAAEGFPTLEKS
jgi:cyclohexanone monooxygenase